MVMIARDDTAFGSFVQVFRVQLEGCLRQICLRFYRVVLFLVIFAVMMSLHLYKYVYLSIYIFNIVSLPGDNDLETTFTRCRLQQMA